MRKITPKSCTNILIILFIISLGSFIFSLRPQSENLNQPIKSANTTTKPNLPLQKQTSAGAEKKIDNATSPTITLVAGNLNTKIEFTEGQTLYQILNDDRNAKLVNMTGKEYKGIGFFITDIGNLHENDGKYIMYMINGVEAGVGVSVYAPKVNDVILFELK